MRYHSEETLSLEVDQVKAFYEHEHPKGYQWRLVAFTIIVKLLWHLILETRQTRIALMKFNRDFLKS